MSNSLTELQHLIEQQLPTVAGLGLAAKSKHWLPKLFWHSTSLALSVVSVYFMVQAWNTYQSHATNVKTTVITFTRYFTIDSYFSGIAGVSIADWS